MNEEINEMDALKDRVIKLEKIVEALCIKDYNCQEPDARQINLNAESVVHCHGYSPVFRYMYDKRKERLLNQLKDLENEEEFLGYK